MCYVDERQRRECGFAAGCSGKGIFRGTLRCFYEEKWKLVSREYPTAVLKGNFPTSALKTFIANQSLGRINCSLNLAYSSPVHIDLSDVKGRLIKRLLKGNLNAGSYRYSWNKPANTSGIVILRVRTGAEDRCMRILIGVK